MKDVQLYIFFVYQILFTSKVKVSLIIYEVNNCTIIIVLGLLSSCDTVFNFENSDKNAYLTSIENRKAHEQRSSR